MSQEQKGNAPFEIPQSGKHLFTDEFVNYLNNNSELDPSFIKKCLVKAFNSETNNNYGSFNTLTVEEEKNIRRWLTESMVFHPKGQILNQKKIEVLIPNVSIDTFSKIYLLAQHHCPLCTSRTNHPIQIIPIRISAISNQASPSKMKKAFRAAISSYFHKEYPAYEKNTKLCIQLIFAMPSNNRDKDLDNMAKAFMDVLQTKIFHNDKNVDHLSLLKIKTVENDPFVYINIRETKINEDNLILFSDSKYTWGNRQFIDLKDFMEP